MRRRGDLIEVAEGNYLAAWRLLAGTVVGGEIEETDAVLCTAVPAPVAFFNNAFVKPPAVPAGCIEQVEVFYGARQRPFTFRFREGDHVRSMPKDVDNALVDAGTRPLMVAAVDDVGLPPDADLRMVDAHNWVEHVSTMAAGFGLPLDLLGGLFTPALLDTGDYAGCILYVDGIVVSTAALVMSDGVAGVYNVATPGSSRRRGFGETVTRAVVAEGARRGCVLTTLQASEMGYGLYERMGYRTVTTWRGLTSS